MNRTREGAGDIRPFAPATISRHASCCADGGGASATPGSTYAMKQRTIILGAIGLSLLLASCAAANDPRPTLLASPIAGNRPTTDEQPIAATSTAAASPAPSHAPTTAGELPSPAATPTGSTTPALTMKLELPATVQSGQSVQLKFIMTNTSTQPVEVYLGGRPAHDFVVSAQDGSEVWRWSHDQTVQASSKSRRLPPANSASSPPSGRWWTMPARLFLPVRTWCRAS
jgi:cytoskeletal protein RodZ